MFNAWNGPLTTLSVGSVMALCIALQPGASVALARPVSLSEAQREMEVDAAITPSAQAIFEIIGELQQRQSLLLGDQVVKEVWAKAEIDYSYMDSIVLAATHAPEVELSEKDKQMYSGLSNFPSVPERGWMNADEPVAIDRTHIARAEQVAAHAPRVVLGADSLRALAGIQTHFPRSIDFDEE